MPDVKGKSTSDGVGKLRERQKRFIAEYLVDLNATQAAIRAGYSKDTAKEIGYENLTKPHIQEAIAEAQNKRIARTQITQDEVIRRLIENVDISMGKKATVITIPSKSENGEVMGNDVAQFVYEPSAANKALELLGKHLGIFKDGVDITSGGKPLQPTIIELVGVSSE
jgi:phage terminase small subunit|nr:MAG TPA: Terminase small subunit [Caudoviricetes sp.]